MLPMLTTMAKDEDTEEGDDDDDDDGRHGMAMVTANGVGNLLKFGSWTTVGMDTLVAVTNLGKENETVNVKIMDGMGMRAGTIPVCLGAGDTWTAAIVASEDGMGSTVEAGTPVRVVARCQIRAFGDGVLRVYRSLPNGYGRLSDGDRNPGEPRNGLRFELQRDLAHG